MVYVVIRITALATFCDFPDETIFSYFFSYYKNRLNYMRQFVRRDV